MPFLKFTVLKSGDKVQLVDSETLKCANVPHVKAATRKLVKKSKFLRKSTGIQTRKALKDGIK
jgi:hypothetical protein